MSSAIGTSTAPSQSPHGEFWVNVRDFGAKADGGVTDNSGPIQAAIDHLVAMIQGSFGVESPVGVVYIPTATNTYITYKPIWVDSNNIEIRGDGWGSQVGMAFNYKHNAFIFGLRRVDSATVNGTTVPLQIDSTYRPDLYGILDSSVVSASGQRWGLRTNSTGFVQIQASPMSAGVTYAGAANFWDYWTQTTQLTVEFCVAPPAGQEFPANAPLFGLGVTVTQPSPFVVATWNDPQSILVTFKTADFDLGQNQGCRYFGFSIAGATPPYRIAIQFDLVNAVCSAFVNGTQVAFTATGNLAANSSPPFTANTGIHFQQNDYYPLMIGASDVRGNFGGSTGVNLSLYGLRFSNTIRYLNNGAGKPQQRVDNPTAAITDSYAYFTNDNNTIGYLTMTDNPATAGRLVTIQHGNTVNQGIGSGLFMNSLNATPCANNAVRDLCVYAGIGHGQAITLGNVLEMTIENFKAINGFHAIGSFNIGANYNIYVRNCFLSGSDSVYYGLMQLISARDIYCYNSGRATIRLVGCNGCWHNVFISFPAPNAECFVKLHSYFYGGNHYLTNFVADFEGPTISLAAIYCEAHSQAPATSLVLKDILLGTVGQNASLVMVKDMGVAGPVFNRCWLSVENLQAYTNTYLAAIDVDGPLWHGEVSGVALNGPPVNNRERWGTTTTVAIRDTKYTAPPRQYLWYSGAHVLEVRSPADGQFAEWRCMATGTYGTTTPPQWVGINPLQLTANGLAGYVLNQYYIIVSLN